MQKILFRLDDRLIHGQVVIGWKDSVDPDVIVLVSDEIAADDFESDLYLTSVPKGTDAKVLYTNQLHDYLENISRSGKNAIFIFENTSTLNKLLDQDIVPEMVNVGGMHYKDNTKEILPYVYVSDDDIGIFKKSIEKGVHLFCQDLPDSKRLEINNQLLSRLI